MAEEKIEKGAISEEALEEIAGGINVSKETLKKAAIGAGVMISAGAGVGGAILTQKLFNSRKKEKPNKQNDPFGDEHIDILDE